MAKPSEFQKILAQIYKHVNEKKWTCLDPKCSDFAINSHLLQQKGVLDQITENGHTIEVKFAGVFKWNSNTPPLEFKLTGITKAISYPLFCSNHDSQIFNEIESNEIDFDDYRTQLLFSYRVVCSELRKKHQALEVKQRVLNSKTLQGQFNREPIELFVESLKMGINDLFTYKAWFEAELEDNKHEFEFITLKYPIIKVYGAAIHSPVDYESDDPLQVEPLDSVFIHIIPHDDHLNIILGYHKRYTNDWIKKYINSWINLNQSKLELKLTDLFVTKIESWGMSPLLYRKIPTKVKDSIIEYIGDNAMDYSIHQSVNFNIFEGENYGI